MISAEEKEPVEYDSVFIGEKKVSIPKFNNYDELVKFLYDQLSKEEKK